LLSSGRRFHTSEAAFQAAKFIDASGAIKNAKAITQLEACEDGLEAWSIGRHNSPIRADWEEVKVDVMLNANRAKLASSEPHRQALLATGDASLFFPESDRFWGTSGGENWSLAGMHRAEVSNWNGLIFMLLREELRPEAEQTDARRQVRATLEGSFAEYRRMQQILVRAKAK
jgi:hypothetical protein